jgi:hypothetical protein
VIRWLLSFFRRGGKKVRAATPGPDDLARTDQVTSVHASRHLDEANAREAPVRRAAVPRLAAPVRRARVRSTSEVPLPVAPLDPPLHHDAIPGAEKASPTAHTSARSNETDVDLTLENFSSEVYEPPASGYAPPPVARGEGRPKRRRDSRPATVHPSIPPALASELVSELGALEERLRAGLIGEPIAVEMPAPGPSLDLAIEYRVPVLESRFMVRDEEGSMVPRTLGQALSSATTSGELAPDELDRIELARLVAMLVEGLHRVDTMSAGVSLDSFAYDLSSGRPALAVVEPDSFRRVGSEFPRIDPGARGMDADRAELAVLVVALLSDGGDELPDVVPGLDDLMSRRLQGLWRRASGPSGSMPRAAEWLEGLAP